MNTKINSILDDARTLAPNQQLELAERLLATLAIDQGDADADLLPELDGRWTAFERGDDPGEDAISAIETMRQTLKERSRA